MKKDIKIPLVEKIQVLAAFEWDKDFLSKNLGVCICRIPARGPQTVLC